MSQLLDDDHIEQALKGLDVAWSALPGQGLVRVFETKNFATSVLLVNQIAQVAEQANHHPDIHLTYNEVEVTLITHQAGGITQQDIELAKAIDIM